MITGAHRQVSSDDLEPDDIVSSEAGRIKIRSVSKTSDQISVLGVLDPPGEKDRRRKTSFKRGEIVTLAAPDDVLDAIEIALLDGPQTSDSPWPCTVGVSAGDVAIALVVGTDPSGEVAYGEPWFVALRPEVAKYFVASDADGMTEEKPEK